MKIRTYLYCFIIAAILPVSAFAQSQTDIKTPIQEYEVFDFNSNQVTIGYGFASANQWLNDYQNIASVGNLYEGSNYWGAMNLGYTYRHSDLITFGLNYTYTGLRRNIVSESGAFVGDNRIDIHVIMPEFKCDWYKKGMITLYSRAAVGVSIANVEDEFMGDKKSISDTAVSFAFQASPIGIEIGNTFAFYAEAGFGYNGIIVAGFRYSF